MVEALSYRCTNPIVTMGLELFALGLVASQLAVYGLVIGELSYFNSPSGCCLALSFNFWFRFQDFYFCKLLKHSKNCECYPVSLLNDGS